MKRILLCTAVSMLFGVVGCGGSDPEPKAPEPPPAAAPMATQDVPPAPPPPAEPAGATPPDPTAQAAPSTPTPAAPALTDEQILHITHTANTGEVEQAKLAKTKAKDAKVKQFAAMMVKDHGDADTKGMALGKKNKLTPAPSTESSTLETDAKQNTSAMAGQKGADFDRAYIDAQVKEHQAVLDMIDSRLLPSAKADDVKGLLQAIRPKIEAHLKAAQDIQKGLASK
jgi:putative membrane protein